MALTLRFGIPSLDDLLSLPTGAKIPPSNSDQGPESYAIVGPDGTGKSVLALHMASRYYADCLLVSAKAETPRIIYVSSDLKTGSATKVWRNFRLDRPNARHIPFERTEGWMERYRAKNYELNLREVRPDKVPGASAASPTGPISLIEYLLPEDPAAECHQIGFLDLASHTAGDDWNFVNALLSKLESIETPTAGSTPLPHLVLIDSVLGFETFVGKLDAYGVEQSRRARIAQCMRNAGRHCHLLFVVEEPNENEHLPEEYVTDVVLRLRHQGQSGVINRTVEIEKARARNHAAGPHLFEIRSKEGSSTGRWENADTPVAVNAYIQVFNSIPHLSALVAADRAIADPSPNEVAGFGLRYLDELLNRGKGDTQGLSVGTCSALIGDASTGKSALAEQFLADGFRCLIVDFIRMYARMQGVPDQKSRLDDSWHRVLNELSASTLKGHESQAANKFGAAGMTQAVQQARQAGLEAANKDLDIAYPQKDQEDWVKWWTDSRKRDEVRNLLTTGEAGLHPDDAPKVEGAAPCNRTKEVVFALSTEVFDPRGGAEALLELFNHPNLRRPAVLLTTSDKQAREVAEAFLVYLSNEIQMEMTRWWPQAKVETWKKLEGALTRLLERQLIVRRFDIANQAAPVVFHVIRRNMMEAKRLIFGPFFPPRQSRHRGKAERIRLVIDDFRVLCNISPQILKDSAFLPFLTFQLERAGITSLLVYTDAVRPDKRPEDDTSRALLSLLKRSILVWNVPFEGRSRLAIAVIPPTSQDYNGIIRELKLIRRKDWPLGDGLAPLIAKVQIPRVTPKFELYSGIEEGKPRPVPLAIYMYAETKQFEAHIEEENSLFRELFASVEAGTAVNPGRVIFPLDWPRYLAMRDYTHLYSDALDAHTMVFQVDGSWAQKGGALHEQDEYLAEEFSADRDERAVQDPFSLFPKETGKRQRHQYFKNSRYTFERQSKDRVPFMWDFGFVLARSAPWEVSFKKALLPTMDDPPPTEQRGYICQIVPFKDVEDPLNSVGGVYDRLSEPFLPGKQAKPYLSWRKFFGACRLVADSHHEQTGAPAVAFDISATSSETINTLLLEIWFSEMYIESRLRGANPPEVLGKTLQEILTGSPESGHRSIERAFKAFKDNKKECGFEEQSDLLRLLPLGALCLYKTWLLLLEVLKFDDYLDPENLFTFKQGRTASMQAVASRHWYKTACSFSTQLYETEGIHDAPIAFRLPGSFSARGDWFLGSPSSSRSRLLARQAFDLLCSRRGNLARMQRGLGLPVRDVVLDDDPDDPACDELRTALRCKTWELENEEKVWRSTQMTYGQLAELGEGEQDGGFGKYGWLWRSRIPDYDRQSRALQKWTARLFRWTLELSKHLARKWEGGFSGYDQLTCRRVTTVHEYPSFLQFARHCDLLVAELKTAARPHGSPDR